MGKGDREPGRARTTGPLGGPATSPLAARATGALPAEPPGWLAPAIAACGLLGAALGAFGLVWHQTRLDLPSASYAPPRRPALAQDAWPTYRDADRGLVVPPAATTSALGHFRKTYADGDAPRAIAIRRGLLVATTEEDLHDWVPAFAAANPGALAALRAARARPAFRVAGPDPTATVARWEEFQGLGAVAAAAVHAHAAARPAVALGHLADGLALGARLLRGGGRLDWDGGRRVVDGLATLGATAWPRLARADAQALAAFARDLDAAVPPGDAGAWLIRGGLDQAWRDAPALALEWRLRSEAEDPALALLFARSFAAADAPSTTRLVRGVLADVGQKLLADRRRGKVHDVGAYPVVPFTSWTWHLMLASQIEGELVPTAAIRVVGLGALSMVLHPDQWAAYMIAGSLADGLTADADEAYTALGRLDGLRVRTALARHARAGGAPPERLEALVPAYLRALPRDPFAPSRPYRWSAGRLRSVGPDGKPGTKDDLALI